MNKIHTLLFFLFFSAISYSQVILSLDDDTVYIDSIAKFTKNVKSDSIKCLNSFRLSKLYLMVQDTKSHKDYLDQGNRLKTKSPFLEDVSLYYNAYNFVEKATLVCKIKTKPVILFSAECFLFGLNLRFIVAIGCRWTKKIDGIYF